VLQELTTATDAGFWASASLLFFVAVYVLVSVRLYLTPREKLDAHARRALDDGEAGRS
jgi:hypothetical protein